MATRKNGNSKFVNKDNVAGEIDLIASADGSGVRILARRNDSIGAPSIETRIPVAINSNILDRYEGQTDTWPIWGEETNKEFVAMALAEPSVQETSAKFFVGRKLAPAIESLITVALFKPSDTLFTKTATYAHVLDQCDGDRGVAQVVVELVLPVLIKIGMVSNNGRFAQQYSYGFDRVEVQAIASEISILQAFDALHKVKIDGLRADHKQSKQVFAETLAEMFRPIGLALANMAELSTVVDDIVRGVRAYLTPPGSAGSDQLAIPSTWYKNPLIIEYAGCLTFIRAALAMPSDSARSLKNEGSALDQWLRLITQMLRDSPRYNWVLKSEALRHYGTMKVRDLLGAPVSLIAKRSIKTDAVAQAVLAAKDAVLKDSSTYDISPTKDKIAETVQMAYGRATFSTDSGAALVRTVVENLVSVGYKAIDAGFMFDAWGTGMSLYDIAALKSDRVFVSFKDGSVVLYDAAVEGGSAGDPRWWFAVVTTEKQLRVLSGQHFGDEILTSDPVEALLAAAEFEPKDTMPARKQLLGPNAFGARVVGFDEDDYLIKLDTKFPFDMTLAGERLHGNFRPLDFASLRTLPLTRLVKPHFNIRVVEALGDAYSAALNLATSAKASAKTDWHAEVKPNDSIIESILDVCTIKLLQLSQELSEAFRQEVQRAVVERVLVSEQAKGEKAMALRGRLTQDFFTAYCDLIALKFFLFLQGMDVPTWTEQIAGDRMERICLTFGSDRKPVMFV